MRGKVPLLIFILVAAPASATASTPGADAGVVQVDVVAATPGENCATPSDVSGLCPVHYDDGDADGVGDDTASTILYVDEVAVTARAPTNRPYRLSFEYENITIEHPGFQLLNKTWVRANDTLPDKAKEIVTMESRPRRDPNGEYTNDWGIFLMYHSPVGDPTGLLWAERSVIHFCWSICELTTNRWTNETQVRPFPDGFVPTYGSSIDYKVAGWDHLLYSCLGIPQVEDACAHLSLAQPHTDAAFETYMELTPNYRIEMIQWNRTEAGIIPFHPSAPPPQPHLTLHASADPANPTSLSHRTEWTPEDLQPRTLRPAATSSAVASPAASTVDAASLDAAKTVSVPPPRGTWALVTTIVATSFLLTLTWWLLYSRINRANALNHPKRRLLHDILQEEPGLKIGTLAKRLDLDYHTVRNHIETLHRVGLLRATGHAHKRYFTTTTPPDTIQERSGPLAAPSTRRVLQHIRRHKRLEQRQLQEDLGLAASTVSEAVTALREAGLVEDRRAGHTKIVSLPTTSLWDHATTPTHHAPASSTT